MVGSESVEISCPYCGERIEITVVPSDADQEYIEDCSVCCRPIVMVVCIDDDGGVRVDARREDD